jgi:hypothetical protein
MLEHYKKLDCTMPIAKALHECVTYSYKIAQPVWFYRRVGHMLVEVFVKSKEVVLAI